MRHVELLRRVVAKKLREDSKKKRKAVEKPAAFLSEKSENVPVKTSEDFILSETAKSIPESLEENTETTPLAPEDKTSSSKKKPFPKKKKEEDPIS